MPKIDVTKCDGCGICVDECPVGAIELNDVAHIDEVSVFKHGDLIDKKIGEIDFKSYKILFIGIQRGLDGEFVFNPSKEIVLQEEDILLLMGLKISIEYFKENYLRSYL